MDQLTRNGSTNIILHTITPQMRSYDIILYQVLYLPYKWKKDHYENPKGPQKE